MLSDNRIVIAMDTEVRVFEVYVRCVPREDLSLEAA
jgi:hypothetical protein